METLDLKDEERHKLDFIEKKRVQSVCSVFRTDIVRNEEKSRRVGVREELKARVNHNVSKWIRHVDRLSGERMMKRVYLYYKKKRVRPSVCLSVTLLIFLFFSYLFYM